MHYQEKRGTGGKCIISTFLGKILPVNGKKDAPQRSWRSQRKTVYIKKPLRSLR